MKRPELSTSALRQVTAVIAVIGIFSCTASTSAPAPGATAATECQPTLAQMTPPTEASEFFARGSSQPDGAREVLNTANWYGNDALWVILPPNREIVGRLDDKDPAVSVEARIKTGR